MMLNLNIDNVLALKPCRKYSKVYLKNLFKTIFNNADDDVDEVHLSTVILKSEIPFCDRLWLIKKLLNKSEHKSILVTWAYYCAKDVLNVFETQFPQDTRPKEALQAAQNYLDGKIPLNRLQKALDAAGAASVTASRAKFTAAAFAAYTPVVYGVYVAENTLITHAVEVAAFAADAQETKKEKLLEKLSEIIKNL